MKVKTNELSGVRLDWAVAQAEGLQVKSTNNGEDLILLNKASDWWYPSESWAQGGPIIERERIELRGDGDGGWIAYDNLNPEQYGPTPLVAAMRCYVASKLGDEVEVPDEI